MQVRKSILILIIIAACLCPYFNTLFADFVWDDNIFITPNPYMKSFKFLPKFFVQDFWKIGLSTMPSGYYRPLLAASFMLDYILWHNNPFGYHLTNVIFHILVSVLIFLFLELLMKERLIPFFAALLFSVHPIHTEAVSFISGRVDSVPLIFFMLSLILFLKYVSAKNTLFYLFSLVCFFMALLVKEMAVTLPLIIITIDYFLLSKQNIKSIIKNFIRLYLGFFIVLAVYLLMRFYFLDSSFISDKTRYASNFLYGIHPLWRFFTVIKILTMYTGLLFFPYNLKAEYLFPPANSLFEPMVLIGLLILLLFLFIAIRNIKKYPIISFSIFWFFITLLPVSNIFPQGNIFAERYAYTPSVGFCIGIAFLFYQVFKKDIKTHYFNWEKSVFIIFLLLIIVLGKAAFERNKAWENEATIWSEVVRSTPNSPRGHANLANVYCNLKLLDEALKEVRIAIELDPNYYLSFSILGHIYLKKGWIDEAIKAYKIAGDLSPFDAEVYHNLALAYGLKGEYKKAIEASLLALEKNPHLDWSRYNLALNYKKMGLINEAIAAYEEYLKTNPDYFGVQVDVGYLYYEKGDYNKAKSHWLSALKISKGYQPAKDALKLLENKI